MTWWPISLKCSGTVLCLACKSWKISRSQL